MALPLYALTLFVSAFILFLVQPIVGKIILPKLGGTPQVWNTCMVFFQMVLLAGYAYTHNVSTRLKLRQQLILHAILLFLPLIVLLPFPFALGGADFNSAGQVTNPNSLWGFVPDLGSNPIPSTLAILFTYVALPFVVVATSAPLLQKWFVHTEHPASKDPYFLYGASNFGSMLSLILYPIVVEPYATLHEQGWIYAIGYMTLIVFVMICAATVWNARDLAKSKGMEPTPEPAPAAPAATAATPETPETGITASAPPIGGAKAGQHAKGKGGAPRGPVAEASGLLGAGDLTVGRRLRWIFLTAIPSSLMLGITTHITTDLSPIPLFWLVPLILYLLSYILVFARWPVVWTGAPHTFFLYAQPVCVWFMVMVDVWNLTSSPAFIGIAIFAHVLGFFTTTMVCHGELAKDRPATKHLTEFYLWMSVGGMCGGIFNGLVSPIIFRKLWELPLAIFAGVLVRPRMFEFGFLDGFMANLFEGQAEQPAPKPGAKGHRHAAVASSGPSESLVGTLDIAWPVVILILTGLFAFILAGPISTFAQVMIKGEATVIMTMGIIFGLPLFLACMMATRPLRIGLGVGAVLLMHQVYSVQTDARSIFSTRSYFGAISVKESAITRERIDFTYRQLIHGHIDHGMNFLPPASVKDRGDPTKDLSRLATTYYHREGPVGRVMEKFNWFPDPPNSNKYTADVRMPCSLVGSAIADVGVGSLPATALVTAWSEPPIATVGLGTGTMASYGRPYQHVHFYEIDNQILRLSLLKPTSKILDYKSYEQERQQSRRETYFTYLEQAIERGCSVQVLMGDARLRMALPYQNHYQDATERGGGPEGFYHMMVVDAFSSDAIPAHLLTEEAFKMYFDRLTEDGVLCVHTSNRFVDLPKVVAAVADKLNLKHKRGHDVADDRRQGHYTSEWVMVARKTEYILKDDDAAFLERYRDAVKDRTREPYWTLVPIETRYRWTDNYYNLLSVVRWR